MYAIIWVSKESVHIVVVFYAKIITLWNFFFHKLLNQ